MADFVNKVITIVSKEETKTKDGNNTTIKLVDQDGVRYLLFKKKKDGSLSSPAAQFKDMGLDENSVVQISYVVESYKGTDGQERTSNKVTGFRETNDQPVKGQAPAPKAQPVKTTYVKEKTVNWDEIAIGKCQTVFLAAFLQSGKTFSDAKLQVVAARQLAELVVNGTQAPAKQQAEEEPLPEDPGEVDPSSIPF